MLFGPAIQHERSQQPDGSAQSDHHKRVAPAVAQGYVSNQRWRHEGTGPRACIEYSHSEGALATRKPLCDSLRRGRPVPRLPHAQHEPEKGEAAYTLRPTV